MTARDVTDRYTAANVVMLDIETAPDPEAVELLLADPPPFTAPKNYKDEAKVDAYVATKRIEWAQDVQDKAGLSPLTGRVVAVAVTTGEGVEGGGVGPDEGSLLAAAADAIAGSHQVVTFNGHAFDLPFLRLRMAKHGIKVPRVLRGDRFPVAPNGVHLDLRLVCTGGDRHGKGTQDRWAKMLGVTPRVVLHPSTGDPVGGRHVAALVDGGAWTVIEDYNRADAETLLAMWTQLRSVGLA